MPVPKIVADYGGSANRAQQPGRVLEAAASPRNNRCENVLGIMQGSMGRGGAALGLQGPSGSGIIFSPGWGSPVPT
jgi:hypothetical protein